MAQHNKTVERPSVACEVTPKAVFAARTSSGGSVDIVQSRALPSGAVVASLTGQNIVNAAAVRDAIRETVMAVAGKTGEVVAVIPDASLRVVLLDFEALPDRRDEAEQVIRFRLKKSMPFDIDKAAVSYDAVRNATGVHVTAAVVLHSVLEEYESVYRDAGCEPGVVIPSTLAALGAVASERPTMLVKVDANTTSVAIVDESQLLLFRTLESGGEISPERLAEDIYPSIVYLQDTYKLSVERVLLAGVSEPAAFGPTLTEQLGAQVEDISRTAVMPTSGRSDGTGAIGALL